MKSSCQKAQVSDSLRRILIPDLFSAHTSVDPDLPSLLPASPASSADHRCLRTLITKIGSIAGDRCSDSLIIGSPAPTKGKHTERRIEEEEKIDSLSLRELNNVLIVLRSGFQKRARTHGLSKFMGRQTFLCLSLFSFLARQPHSGARHGVQGRVVRVTLFYLSLQGEKDKMLLLHQDDRP